MLIACFTFNFALKIVAMSRQANDDYQGNYLQGRGVEWRGRGGQQGVALLQNLFLPLPWVSFAG